MAENTKHEIDPQAPAEIYDWSHKQFAAPRRKPPKKNSKCPVYFLVLVVILTILLLIFGVAVLRVQDPQLNLTSISIKNLSNLSPSTFNATLIAEIDIVNNNLLGYFEYENTPVVVSCENVTVGVAEIHGGRVGLKATRRVTVTVEVRSNDALRLNQNFYSEMNSGILFLRSYAKLVGRVHVKEILNKGKTNLLNCTMALNFSSKAIQDLVCL